MRIFVALGVVAALLSPALAFDPVNGSDFTASLAVEDGSVYLRDGIEWIDEEFVEEESCVPDSECYIHLEEALYDKIMRGGYVYSGDGVTIAVKSLPQTAYAAQ